MSSILTNTNSMTALATLRKINSDLAGSEKHVSTGLRIAGAADNLAYWGLSNNMRTDASILSTVKDGLVVGQSKLDQSSKVCAAVRKQLEQLQKDLAQAQGQKDNASSLTTLMKDINTCLDTIKNAVANANINGDNLLVSSTPDTATFSFITSFRRVNGALKTDSIEIPQKDLRLFGKSSTGDIDTTQGMLSGLYKTGVFNFVTGTGATAVTHPNLIPAAAKIVSDAIDALSNVDTSLGTVSSQITRQIDFVHDLSDNLTKSIGALVDTDMDAESARLSALQVQQQLAVQALSLANQSTQHILALYKR